MIAGPDDQPVTKEVDDVVKTLMSSTPAGSLVDGLAAARVRSVATSMSPDAAAHGTGLSFAGTSVAPAVGAFAAAAAPAQVAVLGARVIDLPGLPPRGAPV